MKWNKDVDIIYNNGQLYLPIDPDYYELRKALWIVNDPRGQVATIGHMDCLKDAFCQRICITLQKEILSFLTLLEQRTPRQSRMKQDRRKRFHKTRPDCFGEVAAELTTRNLRTRESIVLI